MNPVDVHIEGRMDTHFSIEFFSRFISLTSLTLTSPHDAYIHRVYQKKGNRKKVNFGFLWRPQYLIYRTNSFTSETTCYHLNNIT